METPLPPRPAGLPLTELSSTGIVADCRLRPADVWPRLETMGGRGWSTYGRCDDRIAWTHHGRLRKRWFTAVLLFAVAQGGEIGYDTNRDGWLIVEVGPGPDGFGATIEARGELDDAMHRSLGDALGRLGATIVETWDPLAPDDEDQVINE